MPPLFNAIRRDIRAALDSGLFEPPSSPMTDADLIKVEILRFADALLVAKMPEEPLEVDEVKLHPVDPLGDWARFAGHLLNGAWEAMRFQSLDLDHPFPGSMNRPGFARHLEAMHSGNDGGVHEREAIHGRLQG